MTRCGVQLLVLLQVTEDRVSDITMLAYLNTR